MAEHRCGPRPSRRRPGDVHIEPVVGVGPFVIVVGDVRVESAAPGKDAEDGKVRAIGERYNVLRGDVELGTRVVRQVVAGQAAEEVLVLGILGDVLVAPPDVLRQYVGFAHFAGVVGVEAEHGQVLDRRDVPGELEVDTADLHLAVVDVRLRRAFPRLIRAQRDGHVGDVVVVGVEVRRRHDAQAQVGEARLEPGLPRQQLFRVEEQERREIVGHRRNRVRAARAVARCHPREQEHVVVRRVLQVEVEHHRVEVEHRGLVAAHVQPARRFDIVQFVEDVPQTLLGADLLVLEESVVVAGTAVFAGDERRDVQARGERVEPGAEDLGVAELPELVARFLVLDRAHAEGDVPFRGDLPVGFAEQRPLILGDVLPARPCRAVETAGAAADAVLVVAGQVAGDPARQVAVRTRLGGTERRDRRALLGIQEGLAELLHQDVLAAARREGGAEIGRTAGGVQRLQVVQRGPVERGVLVVLLIEGPETFRIQGENSQAHFEVVADHRRELQLVLLDVVVVALDQQPVAEGTAVVVSHWPNARVAGIHLSGRPRAIRGVAVPIPPVHVIRGPGLVAERDIVGDAPLEGADDIGRLHPVGHVAVELHAAVLSRDLRVPAVERRQLTDAAGTDAIVDVGREAQSLGQDARGEFARQVAAHQAIGFVPAREQVQGPVLAAPLELRRHRPVVDAVEVVALAGADVADLGEVGPAEVGLLAVPLVDMAREPEGKVLAEVAEVHGSRDGHAEPAVVAGAELAEEFPTELPLGTLAHVVDRAADAVATVDRILRPAQDLDPFDVEAVRVDSRRAAGEGRETRLVDGHRRLAQVRAAERRADTAHGEAVVVGVGADLEARRHQREVVDVLDLQLLDLQCVESGDRQGNGHLRFLALLRRDDHFLDEGATIGVARLLCPRRRRNENCHRHRSRDGGIHFSHR